MPPGALLSSVIPSATGRFACESFCGVEESAVGKACQGGFLDSMRTSPSCASPGLRSGRHHVSAICGYTTADPSTVKFIRGAMNFFARDDKGDATVPRGRESVRPRTTSASPPPSPAIRARSHCQRTPAPRSRGWRPARARAAVALRVQRAGGRCPRRPYAS